MEPRPLAIATADPEVRAACAEAARRAGDAVAPPRFLEDPAALEAAAGELDGLLVLDPALLAPACAYEWTLGFLRRGHALVLLLTRGDVTDADGLARFVGAQGALPVPPDPAALAERLAHPFGTPGPRRPEPSPPPGEEEVNATLKDLLQGAGLEDARRGFLRHITDPATGLYTPAYWEHRLEEEFKRSSRFRFPLGLVAFSFDGEVDEGTLLEVAGLILVDTRDVDVVAHFEPNLFLALLPHTGPAGTALFARRVVASLKERGLHDLLGEPLEWSWSMAVAPDPSLAGPRAFLERVLAAPTP